ncbi:MAG TPA: hypothetical protein VD886_21440, partial [Herpetosiphonaceae bacterium]|nr:hypothetical protein [Herpetosiphonaceae bacterium]
SAVERLFVLGLLNRFRAEDGASYAIPAEWLPLLPAVEPPDRTLRLAPAAAPDHAQPADPLGFERGLVRLLALAYCEPLALNNNGSLNRASLGRLSERMPGAGSEARWPEATLLRILARDLGLLHERGGTLRVAPGALEWLGLPPAERGLSLLNAWVECHFDELAALVELRWRTPPLRRPGALARRAVLELLRAAPPGAWLDLDQCVAEMQRVNPDFARAGGDYEAWQLTDAAGALLTGWASWRQVDGGLLRAYLAGPLHWLGLLDVGGELEPTHVRLSAWGAAMLGLGPPPAIAEERLVLRADGSLAARPGLPPLPRFQVSRIAAWVKVDTRGVEHYAITARSFDEALERGIGREQIGEFLSRWTGAALPRTLERTLAAWEERRTALSGRAAVLLESAEPELLEGIAEDPRLRLPPHRQLTANAWAFDPADGRALVGELRDHGYGLMANLEDPEVPLSERDLRALLTAALFASAVASSHGIDAGMTAALLERVRRLLPSPARAAAERASADLIDVLLKSSSR